MSGTAIRVTGLTRSFGRAPRATTVLDGVSLDVGYGEVVALLGVNGAGKTTLVKILSTLLLPTSGSVLVAGHDVVREARRVRRATSVVFGGDRGLYSRLTGRENLRFFGMLAGLGRRDLAGGMDAALHRVNLAEAADRRVETYSRGMRQRLQLAIGLVAAPEVLLLDEPTVGLDPVESDRLRDSILHLRDSGVAILLTSHYLLDVEKLATRVLVLADGRIRENLSLAEFVRVSGHAATITVSGRGEPPVVPADRLPPTVTALCTRPDADSWRLDLRLKEWSGDTFALLDQLLAGVAIDDVQVRETRLEEAFTVISRRTTR